MIIYNITIQVNWYIHDPWLTWLRNEFIPEVLATGLFTHHRLVRILETEETEGPTYAIQFFTSSMADYLHYINTFSKKIKQKAISKWSNQFVEFSTVMEVIQ